MIFLSAQPDDIYFIWQLEIQLRNFKSFGYTKQQIHVVIGYNQIVGLKKEYKKFIKSNINLALFFVYPDTRIGYNYSSSIRPHLLEKHWLKNPELEKEVIFYHDSDILITRELKINCLLKDRINYLSDTKSYLDSKYILANSNIETFKKMCDEIGINIKTVYKNDNETGGAQYILKNITTEFWRKTYINSENIYKILNNYNLEEEQKTLLNDNYLPKKIQSWCADMWALLWNIWYFNYETKIHKELDFSWPTDNINQWNIKAIQHYAGTHTDKEKYFYKRDYIYHPPWYDNLLDSIPNTNCSYPIIQLIKKRRKELDETRSIVNAKNISLQKQSSKAYFLFYNKHFIIEEFNINSKLNIPFNYIISPNIIQFLNQKLDNISNRSKIRFNNVFLIDQIFNVFFSKNLDYEILVVNSGKFNQLPELEIEINHTNSYLNNSKNEIIEVADKIFLLP